MQAGSLGVETSLHVCRVLIVGRMLSDCDLCALLLCDYHVDA